MNKGWKELLRFGGSRSLQGSKRLLVVDHDPRRNVRYCLLILLLVAGTAVASFYLGISMAARELGILREELILTKAENSEQIEELDVLRRKVAILERGAWINREAAEEVRLELVKLREEKSVLTRDLSFFRSIMDPASLEEGVNIQSFELLPTSDPGKFQWKFMIVQNAKQHRLQKGNFKARVDGFLGDAKKSYDLYSLSKQLESGGQGLGFRYFQSVPGDGVWGVLELPEGFEPEVVEVSVQLTSPSRKIIKKTFEWLIEESE
ncbi:DUF6776 family protein [Parendozoicomonas sp. Alg238-R29]|uniref:DUF6776 family protein n=1 Tax=Parendozoicomonas sp. Alg238-R29 TaxID=2993446 RepID=UPI00248D833C|nr:DUF6776 family protein [Parendozoicomonas sp. Alg238-R29]